jgi:glycosyltransferase involved in cell wall biosynthesis
MKIGIDISQIVYQGAGVARFTGGLVNAILDYDKQNHWTFFFSGLRRNLDKTLELKIQSRAYQLIKWRVPPTLLSFLWNDLHQFPPLSSSLDWFISSDWAEAPMIQVKKATVVHDLVYLRYPETVDQKIRRTQNRRLDWVKKESKIIFADSQTTKNDLIELLNVDKDKIVVNYPGVDVVKPSTSQVKETLKKYGLKKPFILTVGKLEPRKNLKRLIEAFQRYSLIDLVIVGPSGWGDLNIKYQVLNVKWLGYISDKELYSLYSSCLFFVYPSIWEGFGYPVVEAMKLGAPVACSNTSSIKEIAKDAVLFFDPFNIENMYQCINRLIQDKTLRNRLIKKGLPRSKLFSWESYYNQLIKILYDYRG